MHSAYPLYLFYVDSTQLCEGWGEREEERKGGEEGRKGRREEREREQMAGSIGGKWVGDAVRLLTEEHKIWSTHKG